MTTLFVMLLLAGTNCSRSMKADFYVIGIICDIFLGIAILALKYKTCS